VEIHLPADVQLGNLLGEGRRCVVYEATYRGEPVAVKVYRVSTMVKCRRRYGISLAEFEHRRNSEAYRIEAIRRYIARPIALFGEGDGYSHAFVQERVDGIRFRTVIEDVGGVPPETLAALRTIVDEVNRAGIYDLDLCASNIRVRQTPDGWQPLLFDFNMMPQYEFSRSPFTRFFYKIGWRQRGGRDRRHLADFEDWPNRIRRYRLPLVGLKIRTRLLHRYDFWARRAMDARRRARSENELQKRDAA
jgi:hypothetical protein